MASRCCTCAHMTFKCTHACIVHVCMCMWIYVYKYAWTLTGIFMCARVVARERWCVCIYWCICHMHIHVYLNADECWCVSMCCEYVCKYMYIFLSLVLSPQVCGCSHLIDPTDCVVLYVCMHSRHRSWCVCTLLYWLAPHSLSTVLTHTQADDEIVKMIKEYSVEFGEDPAGANLCFNSCSLSLCLSVCIYVCHWLLHLNVSSIVVCWCVWSENEGVSTGKTAVKILRAARTNETPGIKKQPSPNRQFSRLITLLWVTQPYSFSYNPSPNRTQNFVALPLCSPAHLAVKAFEDTTARRRSILRAALTLNQPDELNRS